jgi:hypothetical protein
MRRRFAAKPLRQISPLRGQEARETRTASRASISRKPETYGINSKHGEAMKTMFEVIQFRSSYRKPNNNVNVASARAQLSKILLRKFFWIYEDLFD